MKKRKCKALTRTSTGGRHWDFLFFIYFRFPVVQKGSREGGREDDSLYYRRGNPPRSAVVFTGNRNRSFLRLQVRLINIRAHIVQCGVFWTFFHLSCALSPRSLKFSLPSSQRKSLAVPTTPFRLPHVEMAQRSLYMNGINT